MNKNKLIYDLLRDYVRSAGIQKNVRKAISNSYNCMATCFNKYHERVGMGEGYSMFFDGSITWSSTDEGYEFWAYHQLRFYYCLWEAKLVSNRNKLWLYVERLRNYVNTQAENELIDLVEKELRKDGRK